MLKRKTKVRDEEFPCSLLSLVWIPCLWICRSLCISARVRSPRCRWVMITTADSTWSLELS